MAGPGISILMPTYNAGDFLDIAVESAAAQLGDDDELLIQDGATTDGSIERIQERYRDNPKVKIVSKPDGGQADALNLALARAVNPLVGWLNGDDLYYAGCLDAARQGWLRDEETDLVYGGWTMLNEAGEVLRVCQPGPLNHSTLVRTPQAFTGAMYMRASAVRDIGGFDADLHFCMDLDLLARLLKRGHTPTLVPETLGGFRWYSGSKIGNARDFGVVREAFDVRRKYAEGVGGHIEAYVFSTTQLLTHLSVPFIRSKFYSRLRMKKSKVEHAATLVQH